MSPLVRPLHAAFRQSTRLFPGCLEGMDGAAARRRASGRTNGMAFIVLHLVDVRNLWARLVGAVAANPFAALLEPARGIDDLADFPPLAGVRAAREAVSAVLDARLPALTGAEPASRPPRRFLAEYPSLPGAIAFLVSPDACRVGQMALPRRHPGLAVLRWT